MGSFMVVGHSLVNFEFHKVPENFLQTISFSKTPYYIHAVGKKSLIFLLVSQNEVKLTPRCLPQSSVVFVNALNITRYEQPLRSLQ
jgi:hypothetical protein